MTHSMLSHIAYDPDGIRVQKHVGTTDPVAYLVGPSNHAGHAQVLEELTFDNNDNPDPLTDVPDSRRTYTIGDDVVTQQTSGGTAQHLLYDGHGSTRQLVSGPAPTSIVEDYSYDAYGVMLGGNPGSAANPDLSATSLLYGGEQFDCHAQQYYLRARYYDPLNGRFNRMDPFAGTRRVGSAPSRSDVLHGLLEKSGCDCARPMNLVVYCERSPTAGLAGT